MDVIETAWEHSANAIEKVQPVTCLHYCKKNQWH